MDPDPDERQQFIDAYVQRKRAEHARIQAMSSAELLADMQDRHTQSWQRDAEMHWNLHQLQQMTNRLPGSRPAPRPAFPPGATVPPDVGSRLEALEDSVALLHTKLDTLIAQIAAWEQRQEGPPDAPPSVGA